MQWTQFLRPNGDRGVATIDVAPDVDAMAVRLRALNVEFEAEWVPGNMVSFEIIDGEDEDGDPIYLASELVPNGMVRDAVEKMVREAAAAKGVSRPPSARPT